MAVELKKSAIEIQSLINWNYIGIAAGILSVVVAIYNINEYIQKQRTQQQ